jgi:HD-like signal output (HDOD) protein
MMTLFVLLGSGLLVLGCAMGWRARRRPVQMAFAAFETGSFASAAAVFPTAAADAGCQALMHRLYGVAFDDATVDGAVPTAHLAIATAAETLLRQIQSQPKYTPRRPQLLPQLMRAANDPDVPLESIARIIGQDPTLSANLLRIANSPFYRVSPKPVESIGRAVTLLGLDGLRPVIAAALVQPVMRTGEGIFGRFPVVVWEHTLLSAAAAADHARRVEHDDAFAAQLLGLLQGLGAIIVIQVLRDEYAKHPDLAPDARVATTLLDVWSGPTARRIADSWGLSARIGQALDAQHPEGVVADPLGRALRIGRIAGALALLCRFDRMTDDEALARLSGLDAGPGRAWDPTGLWMRLRA